MRERADAPRSGNPSSRAAAAGRTAAGGHPARSGAGRRHVAWLLAAAAVLPAPPATARRIGLRAALRARIPLLVIVYPYDRPGAETDAAGAPLPHLEAARHGRPDWLTGARATRAAFRDIFAEPALREAFAALFVRPDRAALLHEGPVPDPAVYQAGFAFLRDGTAPPDGLGLVAVRVRPR
ncbi:hypothetical protein VQH23_09170 [Pararoseomonas sp. SCSIO 73927]|uniref:hypothetical protein n=1 Tax=Pararoseomonas sp. SCSIO 73927 TaxID=3114537 RepID=UPI0030CEC959